MISEEIYGVGATENMASGISGSIKQTSNKIGHNEPSIDSAKPIARPGARNRESGTMGTSPQNIDEKAEFVGWGEGNSNNKNALRDIEDEETKVPIPMNFNMLGGQVN